MEAAVAHFAGTGRPDHAPQNPHRCPLRPFKIGAKPCNPPGQHARSPGKGALPVAAMQDSLKTRRTLKVGDKSYDYFSLEAAAKAGLSGIERLPMSLKVLLENLLRWEDGRTVTVDDLKAMAAWVGARRSDREIAYRPARVLMQDFTGVPAVVDLAAMRDAMVQMGGDPRKINPLSPVDLVIDHSVMV